MLLTFQILSMTFQIPISFKAFQNPCTFLSNRIFCFVLEFLFSVHLLPLYSYNMDFEKFDITIYIIKQIQMELSKVTENLQVAVKKCIKLRS